MMRRLKNSKRTVWGLRKQEFVQFLDGKGLECLHQHVHVRDRMARAHAQAHEFTPATNSQKSVP
jgi:hypothetical protein